MVRKLIIPNVGETALFSAILEAAPEITIRLFQNAELIDDNTELADLTEADYAGYAAQVVAWPAADSVDDGFAGVPGHKAQNGFVFAVFPGNAGSPQTVYGAYATIDLGDGPLLFWAGNIFDVNPPAALDGRVITGPADAVIVVVRHYLWDYFQDPRTPFIIDMPTNTTVNDPFAFTLTLLDSTGNINTGYDGPINLIWSAPDGTIESSSVESMVAGVFSSTKYMGYAANFILHVSFRPMDLGSVGGKNLTSSFSFDAS